MGDEIGNEGWLHRWQEGRIGFHLDEVNPWLSAHAPEVLVPDSRVLVPLCGKSRDLPWLAARGHRVCGVELSEIAVRAFHEEAGLQPVVEQVGAFTVSRSEVGELWCGDFFDLDPEVIGPFDAVWDRASLIAVASRRRPEYVRKLSSLVRPGARGLLLSLHYDPHRMQGPPYSVTAEELRALFPAEVALRLREARDVLEENPPFARRGLDALEEALYEVEWPHEGAPAPRPV